jgi:hypothetical protein
MSCKIPYIEQRFRDVNPSLADTLNTKYSQIWDSVIESELFKKEEDTGKYLMATTNISRLQEQQDFIDKVNQDNSVPEGASVIENLNGYVNVNVLNLPEVTGASTPAIKEGVEELFNENPEFAYQVYQALGFNTKNNLLDFNVIEDKKGLDFYTGSFKKKGEDKQYTISKNGVAKYRFRIFFTGSNNVAYVSDILKLDKNDKTINASEILPLIIEQSKKVSKEYGVDYELYIDPIISKDGIKFREVLAQKGLLEKKEFTFDKWEEDFDKNKYVYDDSFLYKIKENNQITPQQKQQALQQYSQYLDTIFPDSTVKDIVYHGSQQKISEFEVRKEPLIHFGSKNAALQRGNILNQVIVNITDLQSIKDGMWFLGTDEGGLLKELLDRNILTLEQVISINEAKNKAIQQSPYFNENYRMALPEGEKSGNKKLQEILANQNIGFEYINLSEDKGSISYAVPSQKQIHILGNKQDIEGFKEFVNKQPKPTIDYTSLDVTASLDAETKAKIDYLRNNDDLTVQC